MEIASFVKNIADTHRYGIDCIIDTDKLLALALSKMPNACIEPMESCNDSSNTNTVTTITCEGGNITLDSQTITTSHILNQINVFGKGVINDVELKTNKTFSASVKGVGFILEPKLTKIAGVTTVTDIDGNVYSYVTIGDYDWFTSNLKVTKLNDNTSLVIHNTPSDDPYVTSINYTNLWNWYRSEQFLYSWYDNNINNKSRGALYNKYSAMNPKICPEGWRVPTYQELNNMIIANNDRIRSTLNWTNAPIVPNPNGFNLIPNGYKIAPFVQNAEVLSKYNAKYYDQNSVSSLWTTTQVIQLDNSNIIPVRPNIDYPTSIPGNLTTSYLDTTRGAYGTDLKTWTPFYAPTGNCIRCMRNKII